ncbi:MarR family transcriptional regulator [Xinfangfangia sp. D13-10-4-6]|uniref:MarR family winged helix-turn-helix transcriptional regulator n=1 Tax=Pseudogemmobacter hezensis TaxID=2737662 RepID=UPI0015525000|nr:MarR family transcriptional regulator [Pseudogemmobacter hezensis]NPD17724.1 MarR family transcriptional regulator [Pseudogemmobacter hezensis]
MHMHHNSNSSDLAPKLIAVAQSWRRAVAQALADQGLSDATALPLVMIARAGRAMRQNELAASLGLEGTSIVRTLDTLEREGLALRQNDPDDRRAKLVCLTPAGEALAGVVETVFAELRAELLCDAKAAEIAATLDLLDKIGAVLARKLDKRKG